MTLIRCHASRLAHQHHAFTLVELSIVIVIIGLIVGGIVGGRSIIEAAQRGKMVSQVNGLMAAFRTFQDKYDAYPGDMANASSYWSSAANGNGSNTIDSPGNEPYYAWKHMALAGMIEGSYSGLAMNNTANLPRSALPNTMVFVYSSTAWGSYGTAMIVMNPLDPSGYSMPPEYVWNLDKKVDDGYASRGKMFGVWGGSHCGDGISSTGYYNLTYTTNVCKPWFWVEY